LFNWWVAAELPDAKTARHSRMDAMRAMLFVDFMAILLVAALSSGGSKAAAYS